MDGRYGRGKLLHRSAPDGNRQHGAGQYPDFIVRELRYRHAGVFKERQGTQRTDCCLFRGRGAPYGVHSEPVQPQDILSPLAASEGRAVPE